MNINETTTAGNLLDDPEYLSFPFRIDDNPAVCRRMDHVRQQIEMVLFTAPQERVFRPEFGVGIKSLVFEPNNNALWEVTRKRLVSSLREALQGEVDPQTLEVEVNGEEENLILSIAYQLTTLGIQCKETFVA